MNPIERIKAHLEKCIEDAADCGYSAAERREELSALDALIAENAALRGCAFPACSDFQPRDGAEKETT